MLNVAHVTGGLWVRGSGSLSQNDFSKCNLIKNGQLQGGHIGADEDVSRAEESSLMLLTSCSGVLIFINCAYVKWGTLVQDIFTYAKLMALFLIIIVGLLKLSSGKLKETQTRSNKCHVLNSNFVQEKQRALRVRLRAPPQTPGPSLWPFTQRFSPTLAGTRSTSSRKRFRIQRGNTHKRTRTQELSESDF